MSEADQGAARPPEALRFRLYGGLSVTRDGRDVALNQPKQRAILALLLATDRSVPVSEMIDACWPREPAASVLNQIHRHIGALRRVFEPELGRRQTGRYLASVGNGYRIHVSPENLDVLRFRATIAQAERLDGVDRRRVFGTYLSALAIASAPAGDDLLWTRPVFAGLEDERIRALVTAAEYAETADEYASLRPALRAATALHPLDESLHAAHMTALCRTGRPSEALELYRTIQTALREELGTSPSAALEAAQAIALGGQRPNSAPADPRPAPVPSQLPSPPPAFAGRAAELAALRRRGTSSTLLITGMAGVGKTSLALRHALDLAGDFPDGQLYVNLRGFDPFAPPTEPREALMDLLLGLGVASQSIPESLGARSGLLRSILTGRRILLVLDNARNYQQVEPLLPGAGANLAIITSRHSLPGLVALNQAVRLELQPFTQDEILEFFALRLPAARVEDHHEPLIRLGLACGRLPLALAVVVSRLQANPGFPLDLFVREFTGGQARLPALAAGPAELDLRMAFSWSHQGLSSVAARLFAVLSAHPGPEITIEAAVSLSGFDVEITRKTLVELAQASMLRAIGPDRFAFHDLVREYALDLLGDGLEEATRRLVNHYVQSMGNSIRIFGQSSAARPEDLRPGVVPERFTSTAEATAWYAAHRHVIHAVCHRAYEIGDFRSALTLMLDWRPVSQAIDTRRDMLAFAELAIEAARQVDDPALTAEAHRDVASNFARTDQYDRARAHFDEAIAAYQQSGDQLGLSGVYRSMGVTLPMDSGERIRLLLDSVAVVRELDELPDLALALHSLGLGYLWAGQYADAIVTFGEAHAAAGESGTLDHLEPHLLSARARAFARVGRHQEALIDGERALEIFRRDGSAHAELRLLRSHGEVLTTLGRHEDAAEAWRRYLTLSHGPEHIRETNALDDQTEGATTLARITAKLADLGRQ